MEDLMALIGIPIFIAMFVLMFYVIIPRLGGWKKLAKHYATNQDKNTVMGERIHFGQINIGGLNMKNMVKGYKTHKGLFLTQYLFFQGPNPNLMIPWEEFQVAQERRFLFIKRYRIPVGNPQVSYIDITARKYELIADRLP